MIRHKWDDNECVKCGILRERTTVKTRMAIVGGRDIYKYETKFRYVVDGQGTLTRPICWRDTYHD